MKLVINYDFFRAVCIANEKFVLVNLMRNYKKPFLYGAGLFPLYLVGNDIQTAIGKEAFYLAAVYGTLSIVSALVGDGEKQEAMKKLKNLVVQFDSLNLSTDFDLLLQSELYEKKYKFEVNKKILPSLVEKKYILVPTYDYRGEIQETSIEQEHVVGSKTYVLSIGSPSKKKSARLATSYA